MKKLLLSLLVILMILPVFGQNQDEFKFSLVPRRVAIPTLTGYILADGTVPLTADWNVGAFDLTAKNFTASPTLGNEALTNVAGWTAASNWTVVGTTWSHATGSATALTATGETAIAVGTKYQITMVLTTSVAGGGLAVSLGGQSFAAVSTGAPTSYVFNVTALSTAALAITPTSGTWVGSLTISVKIKTAATGIVTAEGITLNSGQLSLPNGNATYPAINFGNGNYIYAYPNNIVMGTPQLNCGIVSAGNIYCSSLILGNDSWIMRESTAVFQLGPDAAAPVDQAIKGPDGLGTDKPGGMFTIQGGASTGTGLGGGVRIQTSTTSTTGPTANTEYTRYRAVGKVVTLTDGAATDAISFAVTAGQTVGGMLVYTIKVVDNDASDVQVESGVVYFCGLQDEANWHTNISEVSTQALESGALATTWAIDTATANTLKITCNADSDLTTPVITLRYQLFLNSPIVETVL